MRARRPLGAPHIELELPAAPGAFAQWRQHLSFVCEVVSTSATDENAFAASSRMYPVGKTILLRSQTSQPHRMLRSGRDIARSAVDLVQISLHLAGHFEGRCANRRFTVQPGDISIVDYGLPFQFDVSAFDMIGLLLPRSAMPKALGDRDLHGFVSSPDHPLTPMLADLFVRTNGAIARMTASEADAAAAAMLMLADGLSQNRKTQRPEASTADVDLFSRAQAFIERHIVDRDLGVERLQFELGVSRRALYAVFVGHGGVLAYIRERRLQRCQEILKAPGRRHERVGAVAFSMGFNSEAQFSRAFRQRFGISPGELRQLPLDALQLSTDPTIAGVAPDVIQSLID